MELIRSSMDEKVAMAQPEEQAKNSTSKCNTKILL
jgi:hypothetical protein